LRYQIVFCLPDESQVVQQIELASTEDLESYLLEQSTRLAADAATAEEVKSEHKED
jgi:hypothetical protein